MASNLVQDWFGDEFSKLSPQLQELHRHGGILAGTVEVEIGKGIAGFIGRRLAKKLQLPATGKNHLQVTISHADGQLHWDRCFNSSALMKSTFRPVGTIKQGHWLEKTGPLQLKLSVDIKNGGWYWHCLGFSFFHIPLPAWLFPQAQAYKFIDQDDYCFFVGFRAPLLGLLLSYGGRLQRQKA